MQQLLADKREREKRVVAQMIQLYCSKQHHNGATLCKECSCLLSYANERIEHCPFIKEKTFCSNCQVHCYQPQMREQIRQVMRYAGPRMLLHHPVLAVRHLLESRREKNKQEGCLGCVLGAVGAVLPLLPSFPFLMLAAWCFAKSSQKLHNWFVHTNLYKKNLESYVQGRGMTLSTKLRIILMVSGLMGIGFVMMHNVPVGRVLLVLVWVFHLLYFSFGVKTLKAE